MLHHYPRWKNPTLYNTKQTVPGFSPVSTSLPSKFQPRAGMGEYLKNLIPAIPKRSLVSWEHRKPLWPGMRVFSSSITTAADAGAAQRVWISWHSLRVHTTISGMLTSHTPSSPPSKGNWRAKRWDFSKRDPKCDNSWLVEQLTQHLGLGGFTFQQEKEGRSQPQGSQNGACSTSTSSGKHQRLTQKPPLIFCYQYSPLSCFFSHFLLLLFPPRTSHQRIQLEFPSLGESEESQGTSLTPQWSFACSLKGHFSLKLNQQTQSFLANLWASVTRW